MRNVLSQEEVDSLLNGIGEGRVKTETNIPATDEGVPLYDFSKEAGPIHLRLPTLGMINERFIVLLKTSLSNLTGSIIDVNISDIESVRFKEFCRSLPLPTSLSIFKMEPLRGLALLVLEGSLVFAFVDTFFGGKCVSPVRLEGKSFTPIEVRIIEKIVKIVLEELQQAWSEVHKVEMVFTRLEIEPQFAGITTPDGMVIAIRISIEIGTFSGLMTICIPYSNLEPIKEKLRQDFQSEKLEVDQSWRRHMEKRIMEVKINLSCTLGTGRITGRELLKMKVGDVIQLHQKTSEPVMISTEGIPKFQGYPGSINNKKAIKISGRLNKE